MKKTDISTIHETVLHGDLRFHLMVHEYASDPSRSERVTSHWHEEYELLILPMERELPMSMAARFLSLAGISWFSVPERFIPSPLLPVFP